MKFSDSNKLYPSYLDAYESGLLQEKVKHALNRLECCHVCPRDCGVNRLENQWAVCKSGRYATVSSYFPHFGEENCLRGWRGSGTIFFSHCNLRCVFCQNHDISQLSITPGTERKRTEMMPAQLARMMISLQEMGCHNINFVTPEHVVPQIIEALPLAIDLGLRLPLVYNTSAFDSLDSISMMEGLIDIYMPDFKFWGKEYARKYLKAVKYPETAQAVIQEMYRQVGDLKMDSHGLAVRGLLVRHLVMPGMIKDSQKIFQFLHNKVSPDTYVNIMAQYQPAYKVNSRTYPEINRPIYASELQTAYRLAKKIGLHRFDEKHLSFI